MQDVLQPDKKKQTVVVGSGKGTALEPFEEGSCPESGQVEAVGDVARDHKTSSAGQVLPPMVTPQINASRIFDVLGTRQKRCLCSRPFHNLLAQVCVRGF